MDGVILTGHVAFASFDRGQKAAAAGPQAGMPAQFTIDQWKFIRGVCAHHKIANYPTATDFRKASAQSYQMAWVVGRSYFYKKDGAEETHVTIHLSDGESVCMLSVWAESIAFYEHLFVEGTKLIMYRVNALPKKADTTVKFPFQICCRLGQTHFETADQAAIATAAVPTVAAAAAMVPIVFNVVMPTEIDLANGYEFTPISKIIDKSDETLKMHESVICKYSIFIHFCFAHLNSE